MEYEIRKLRRDEVIQVKEMKEEEGNFPYCTDLLHIFDRHPEHFYCAVSQEGKVLCMSDLFVLKVGGGHGIGVRVYHWKARQSAVHPGQPR